MYFHSLNSTTKAKKFPLSCQQTSKLLYFQAEKNDEEGCSSVSPYEVTVTRGTTAVSGETHSSTADIHLTGLQPNATHSVTIASRKKQFTTPPLRKLGFVSKRTNMSLGKK